MHPVFVTLVSVTEGGGEETKEEEHVPQCHCNLYRKLRHPAPCVGLLRPHVAANRQHAALLHVASREKFTKFANLVDFHQSLALCSCHAPSPSPLTHLCVLIIFATIWFFRVNGKCVAQTLCHSCIFQLDSSRGAWQVDGLS